MVINDDNKFNEKQVVAFNVHDEEFGVDISEVREITKLVDITEVPETDSFVDGVINVRGGIVVVVDLAKRLGLPVKKRDNNTRIIIIESGENTVGMVVDSCNEVMRINNDNIEPAPEIITKRVHEDYLEGVGVIGNRLIILLDLVKVINDKAINQVKDAHSKAVKK